MSRGTPQAAETPGYPALRPWLVAQSGQQLLRSSQLDLSKSARVLSSCRHRHKTPGGGAKACERVMQIYKTLLAR